jgi:hypothetical protein
MDSTVYLWLPPVLYLISVWLLQRFMRPRAPITVPTWFQALHNGLLVLLSIYMAVVLLYEAFFALDYRLLCNQVVRGELRIGECAIAPDDVRTT